MSKKNGFLHACGLINSPVNFYFNSYDLIPHLHTQLTLVKTKMTMQLRNLLVCAHILRRMSFVKLLHVKLKIRIEYNDRWLIN